MKYVLFSLIMPMARRFILYSFWCIPVLFSQPLIASGASPGLINPRISAGWYHTVAVKSDGTVWAWGCNDHGQLGDGTNTNRNIPVSVKKLSGVTSILCGMRHTVTLKADGTVWAWGRNDFGQLGDGTNKDRSTPVQVKKLSDVTAILCGMWHTVALKADGTVWAWGRNDFGQLGDGTTTERDVPVQIKRLSNVINISSRGSHTVALKSDGTVWAWGRNDHGQLGDGTTKDYRSDPAQVGVLSGVIAIAVGEQYSVALKTDGTVWTWGHNDYGQLGDGTNTDRNIPVQVNGLSGVIAVAAGERHTVALKSDGMVWTWGYNTYGQLGDGTNTERNTPVQVREHSITAIAAGWQHTVALKSNGTVWTWGNNSDGQLGDGTNVDRNTPVQVKDINLGLTITKTASFGECELRSIVINESVLNLERGVNYNIKVTLSGSGCLVQNKKITAKINWMGKRCISVLPSSALSDENGEAMFIIKTKNKSGRATVTFKADSLRKDLIVVVKK